MATKVNIELFTPLAEHCTVPFTIENHAQKNLPEKPLQPHKECKMNASVYYCGSTYLGQLQARPPSTHRLEPVVKLASLDARNAIALATSSGCPTLPIGCVFSQFFKN